MTKRFPSVTSDQWAYAFTTDPDYITARNPPVCNSFQRFETLGDGMCAHSPDYNIGTDCLLDYLQSIAVAMYYDHELAKAMSYRLPDTPEKTLEFCRGLRFHEKHRQWYSLEDRQVSRSDSKRHDRRFEEVKDWHDGSADAISRTLWCDWHDPWTIWVRRVQIRDFLSSRHDMWVEVPLFPGLDRADQQSLEIHSAYQHITGIAEAVRKLDWAAHGVGQFRDKLKSRMEVAA